MIVEDKIKKLAEENEALRAELKALNDEREWRYVGIKNCATCSVDFAAPPKIYSFVSIVRKLEY